MHISTRQCKTTFCTHYKVLAAEEEGTGTWLAACLQSRPVSNRECVAHFEAQNATTKTLYCCAHLKTCLQEEWDKITPETLHHLVSSVPKRLLSVVKRNGNITSGKCFTVPTLFGMCCRSEWQERMYIYKWHEVDQTKHEIFCVHIVCNEIQVKVNLEITTFFFYLRFPYCPNFFWFGVVKHFAWKCGCTISHFFFVHLIFKFSFVQKHLGPTVNGFEWKIGWSLSTIISDI